MKSRGNSLGRGQKPCIALIIRECWPERLLPGVPHFGNHRSLVHHDELVRPAPARVRRVERPYLDFAAGHQTQHPVRVVG